MMHSESDRYRQLEELNQTRTDYPRDKTVHGLFEEVVARGPASGAMVYADGEMTYGELNVRANRVAHHLQRLGIRPGTLVGLCVERSPEMVVALLAILKAGGAYVPLDPDYPDERIGLMLHDAEAKVILAHRPTASRLAPFIGQSEVISVDSDHFRVAGGEVSNPKSRATADDLAYVIYTSGSTGTPKGVMVGHRAVARLVRNTNYCDFGCDQVFLHVAPISFDASTFEIWGPLLNGARLAIMPAHTPALDELGEAIRRHGVTTLFLTTALFNLMVDQRIDDLKALSQLLNGGEAESPLHFQKAIEALPDGAVVHVYGPTESTTYATYHRLVKGQPIEARVPIGRPISNTTVYLLDEQLRPVPIGEDGELCIGGDGLAHGYLNSPELTRQKFIPDPFSNEPGARLYRTGDLARQRDDGAIEFVGRIDSQVKILGHRIEPGEIEAVLRQHGAVSQAVVVPDTGPRGDKRLVAYFIGKGSNSPTISELKDYLAERLPHYMIPSSFIKLASFPLSHNGKVDRSALPTPEQHTRQHAPSASPVTHFERHVSAVWEQVLSREISLDDNFFDLGGDSLQLIEAHSELQKRLGREVSLMDLFEHTTVRGLAGHLAAEREKDPSLDPALERARKQKEALSRQRQSKVMINE
jgi:amino acid adenylation domain-containing protein